MRTRQAVISPLVEIELASVLARKLRMREISAADAGAALALFHAHQDEGLYRVLPVEAAHFQRARRWMEAFGTPLRTLDALHLAVSFDSGCVLVTADATLAQAASRLHVRRRLLRS